SEQANETTAESFGESIGFTLNSIVAEHLRTLDPKVASNLIKYYGEDINDLAKDLVNGRALRNNEPEVINNIHQNGININQAEF
ncbi:hypothetical protein KC678_05450, partial [Candidatus Dojkabacteria bacterium]|nr:hypothetical protein [Candidatus Dojkabacteria bacterium]